MTSSVDGTLDTGLACTAVMEPSILALDVVSDRSGLVEVVLGKVGPGDTDAFVSGVVDDDPSVVCLPVSLLDACETVSAMEFEGGMLVWLSDEAGVTSAVSPLEDSER